jgi:hypothetical protein
MKTAYGVLVVCCFFNVNLGAKAPAAAAVALKKRIIFSQFFNEPGEKNYAWLEKSVIDAMHANMRKKYSYEKIDEDILGRYMAANGYLPQDRFDREKLRRMGLGLKADGIIFGKFSIDAKSKKLELTGKILSIADDAIIAEKTVYTDTDARIFNISDEISTTLADKIKDLFIPSDTEALWRSAVLPGWGQRYKGRRFWGNVWTVTFAVTAAFAIFTTTNYFIQSGRYTNYSVSPSSPQFSQSELDSRYSSYQTSAALNYAGLGLLAVTYVWNLIDTFFVRGDYAVMGTIVTKESTGIKNGFSLEAKPEPAALGGIFATGMQYNLKYAASF